MRCLHRQILVMAATVLTPMYYPMAHRTPSSEHLYLAKMRHTIGKQAKRSTILCKYFIIDIFEVICGRYHDLIRSSREIHYSELLYHRPWPCCSHHCHHSSLITHHSSLITHHSRQSQPRPFSIKFEPIKYSFAQDKARLG
jgi:hypothetical protein